MDLKPKIIVTNPLFWLSNYLSRNHKCVYETVLHDIVVENNVSVIISQCNCGKTVSNRLHRESQAYQNLKTLKLI
jgi:hypothetical protein